MYVLILQFEVSIPGAESLKDKRSVIRSLKDRLHREHMLSVAEVGANDEHRHAVLAAALVSADAVYGAGVLDRVTEKLRDLRDARLVQCRRCIIREDDLPEDDAVDAEGRPAWSESDTQEMLRGLDAIERDLTPGGGGGEV